MTTVSTASSAPRHPDPQPRGEYMLVNARHGWALAERMEVARSSWRRAISLVGRRWFDRGEGLRLLLGCSGRPRNRLPVDLLFLDRDGVVLYALHSLPPLEAMRGDGVHSVVQLPAGTLMRLDTGPGDVVEMYRAREPQPDAEPEPATVERER